MARCLRRPASARAAMPSNSGERWLISMTDMPVPRQSSSSSRMRSSTGMGRAAGPALKLKARLMLCAETVAKLTIDQSFPGAAVWRGRGHAHACLRRITEDGGASEVRLSAGKKSGEAGEQARMGFDFCWFEQHPLDLAPGQRALALLISELS